MPALPTIRFTVAQSFDIQPPGFVSIDWPSGGVKRAGKECTRGKDAHYGRTHESLPVVPTTVYAVRGSGAHRSCFFGVRLFALLSCARPDNNPCDGSGEISMCDRRQTENFSVFGGSGGPRPVRSGRWRPCWLRRCWVSPRRARSRPPSVSMRRTMASRSPRIRKFRASLTSKTRFIDSQS